MNTILVAYTTMSGSTAEVAGAIGEEITGKGWRADVLPLEKVSDFDGYDAIVLGAPMIVGWHRSALQFLKLHRQELGRYPLAVFATAMNLTLDGEKDVKGVPVYVDEKLPVPPRNSDGLTLRERYASVTHYFSPILKVAQPVSVAIFGGRLDYNRLKLPARLFVMLVVQARPGDKRNWPAIRSWAGSLPSLFNSRKMGT